jgi:hypothetical protein
MNQKLAVTAVSLPIDRYLKNRSEELLRGDLRYVRLFPLTLARPVEELVRRRQRLFAKCDLVPTDYGYQVFFSRKLKPSRTRPLGRTIEGCFEILGISQRSCLIASSLDSDAEAQGPRRLANRTYPYAKRPFITSIDLTKLINDLAEENGWEAVSLDAIGYDRETHKFRRDMKRQSIDEVLEEMKEQGRDLHRTTISFGSGSEGEVYRASFDRYGTAAVFRGPLFKAVLGFLLRVLNKHDVSCRDLAIRRENRLSKQKMIQLVFPAGTFETHERMAAICIALRRGNGLSVSTIHLNPYLQAQVLDFMTGEAVEVVILNDNTVSLIPRSENCGGTLERVVSTVFRFFGEGQVRQGAVMPSSRE